MYLIYFFIGRCKCFSGRKKENELGMRQKSSKSSKDHPFKKDHNTKCMEKVLERYPDAKCKIVDDMSSCIKMCETTGNCILKIEISRYQQIVIIKRST